MISLEGLTLTTGRHAEAGYILRTFAHYVRDGLIPNLFPEGETRGPLPHRRRHALVLPRPRPLPRGHRRPRHAASSCCPTLQDIVDAPRAGHALRHRRRPGRRPAAPGRGGLPAHLDGRQGRRLGGHAAARQGGGDQRPLVQRPAAAGGLARARRTATPRPRRCAEHAERARALVQRALLVRGAAATSTTWSTASTGDDPACRPNQLFAISLPHPVLDDGALAAGARRRSADRLLTPVGLRSLAPGHPDYKPTYYGDLRARDAAYHQGTVWAWLIGPFIDAWLKVHPDDRAGARRLPGGLRRPPGRGLRRLDQRGLRRRAALHAARLRRPGLERGRGAALPSC